MVLDSRRVLTLVGCSGPKLDHAAPARDLYTSDLFLKARSFAESNPGPWGILSAAHGLVWPDKVLVPYNLSLSSASPRQLESFDVMVEIAVRYHVGALRLRRIVVLAGDRYAEPVRKGAGSSIEVAEPLKGLGIGERLSWLKRECGLFVAPVSA